jgi:GH25 family lysozyme M1 (1,4-beta-N-acetylmuramidase)
LVAEPPGPKVPVVDTSQYRGHIDAEAVAASGVVGLWPRTTYVHNGVLTLDPLWHETATRALHAGLVVSARHRLYRNPSVQAQFDFFVRHAEAVSDGAVDLVIASDAENDSTWDQVTQFEELCKARWGEWPVMYYPCWWLRGIGNPTLNPEAVFWHSRYASEPGDLCGGRTTLAGQLWQYTDSGTCPGVAPPVDRNWFYGTRAELEALVVD